MMLSFLICVALIAFAIVVSLLDRTPAPCSLPKPLPPVHSKDVYAGWIALAVVMISLYIIFN